MSRLNQKLLKHVPVDDREAYERQLEKLLDFIEPISLTLDYETKKIIEDKTGNNSFESQNWAYQQAYYNGQIQAFKLVKNLLKLKSKEE